MAVHQYHLTDYHEFCDRLFTSHSPAHYISLSPAYIRNVQQVFRDASFRQSLDNCHKLDVLHCIDGFCGEVLELIEHLNEMEYSRSQNEFLNRREEAYQEIGDLLFYKTQLQTLLRVQLGQTLQLPSNSKWFHLQEHEMTGEVVEKIISDTFNLEQINVGYVGSEFCYYAIILCEQVMNLTKKWVHYKHDVDPNTILDLMNLLVNGFRTLDMLGELHPVNNKTIISENLEFFRQLNIEKLKKRHPTGKFTPEAAEAKVDQNPTN